MQALAPHPLNSTVHYTPPLHTVTTHRHYTPSLHTVTTHHHYTPSLQEWLSAGYTTVNKSPLPTGPAAGGPRMVRSNTVATSQARISPGTKAQRLSRTPSPSTVRAQGGGLTPPGSGSPSLTALNSRATTGGLGTTPPQLTGSPPSDMQEVTADTQTRTHTHARAPPLTRTSPPNPTPTGSR